MQFLLIAFVAAIGPCHAKSMYSEWASPSPLHLDPTKQRQLDDPLAMARQKAIKMIMEKMLIALGPDFVRENHRAPDTKAYPTVASPLNITTDPCPEIYTKCSSEIFLSSCDPPIAADADLWSQRRNLYFELPPDLLANDQLLNATLRIYKNGTLPVRPSSKLIIELYIYKKSLTKVYDVNSLYDSKIILNDYIGWISFEITKVIDKINLKDHHGFFIKVRQEDGLYWNDPNLLIPMNCSNENKTVVPVPFGVKIDQPEQRYPSLTIHTGMIDQRYYNANLKTDDFNYGSEILSEEEDNTDGDLHPYEHKNLHEEGEAKINESGEEVSSYHQKYHHDHMRKDKRLSSVIKQGDGIRDYDESYRHGASKSSGHVEWEPHFDVPEEQGNMQPHREYVPGGLQTLARNLNHRYHTRSSRKPVVNQVYREPFLFRSLNTIAPSEASPTDDGISSKEWQSLNQWPSMDDFEGHQQGIKSRPRPRRRHQNRYRQRKNANNGHLHHSHSHSRSRSPLYIMESSTEAHSREEATADLSVAQTNS